MRRRALAAFAAAVSVVAGAPAAAQAVGHNPSFTEAEYVTINESDADFRWRTVHDYGLNNQASGYATLGQSITADGGVKTRSRRTYFGCPAGPTLCGQPDMYIDVTVQWASANPVFDTCAPGTRTHEWVIDVASYEADDPYYPFAVSSRTTYAC